MGTEVRKHVWEHVEDKLSSYKLCRRCGMTTGHTMKEFCQVTWKTEFLELPGTPKNPGIDDCDYEIVRQVMES
jgi:hypothetical protein